MTAEASRIGHEVAVENGAESEVRKKARLAKAAAWTLAKLSTQEKDAALLLMAEKLEAGAEAIVEANQKDLAYAKERGMSSAFIDRLTLTVERVRQIAKGVREVVDLPDPVGETVRAYRRPNGLEIAQVRVPLGVVGIIYEARPNVTADAAALCLKSGNAALLRGSSDALHSNVAITERIQEALVEAGLPREAVQLIEDTDRAAAQEMMRLNGLIDVLIPRGGAGLIKAVVENATVPVIETGIGVCHIYVDADADFDKAEAIVINAKTRRVLGVQRCGNPAGARENRGGVSPRIGEALKSAGVEIRACEKTLRWIPSAKPAVEEDWYAEYLDLVLAVKVVGSLDEAIDHIETYGSHHSDAIVTENYSAARRFTREVDSAAVYVNASTYFTDGNQFGFGAEIGISTQKLHARGPMGLPELTSTKYVILGDGHIRV